MDGSFAFFKICVKSNLSLLIAMICLRKLDLHPSHEVLLLYFSLMLYDFIFYISSLIYLDLICV